MVRAFLVGVFLILLAALPAAAQPARTVQIGGETWLQSTSGDTDVLRRPDGLTVQVKPAGTSCAARVVTSSIPRPDWVSTGYWPVVESASNVTTLCLERGDGGALVVITPPAGKGFDATLATVLRTIAEELRPPTQLEKAGLTFHPSLPVLISQNDAFAFATGGDSSATLAATRHRGTCAYDHALTLNGVAKPTLDPAPPGYWPTPYTNDSAQVLCIDLREEYLQVLVTPRVSPPPMLDILEALRRSAIATYGEAQSDDGELLLPRAQATLAGGAGAWKVVDGARFDVAGDVLVSTARLTDSTMYAIGVVRGTCTPGASTWYGANAVFPAEVGTVWADDGALRWRAWACVQHQGAPVAISVVGPVASRTPPDARDAPILRALVVRVAASLGVVTASTGGGGGTWDNGGGGGGGDRTRAQASGHFGFYGGVLRVTPDGGDPAFGGLVGFNLRGAKAGGGWAGAMNIELGYGAGETVGEIRAGGGFAVASRRAVFDVMGGLSVGSTGPGAAVDAYVDASLGLYRPGQMVWLGAMRAWGADGPGHYRLEVRLGMPKRDSSLGVLLGIRYLRFTKDAETMMDNGDAMLVTLGWGLAKAN